MGFISVIAAGAAAWIFGAVWYMSLAKPWMAANNLKEEDMNRSDPLPYIVSFVMAILVAGMMRHMFGMAGIEAPGKSLLAGLGLGAFVALPWMVNNIMYSNRSKSLIWLDGGYVVGGCAIIGLVLALL